MTGMTKPEAMEIIKELVTKFIDVDQGHLTSSDRNFVLDLLGDFENIVETFKE